MKPRPLFMVVSTLFAAATAAAGGPAPLRPLDYEIRNPHGWVYLASGAAERRVRKAAAASAGDLVRTAWFSRTEIDVPSRRAHFVLGPWTRARLAEGTPGVLLELERGRLRAALDKLIGDESPRLVTTPGAIVAVRGTRLGISVDRYGDTTVAVFEGVVEVRSRSGVGATVRIPAGAFSLIPFGAAPEPPLFEPLEEESWEGLESLTARNGEIDREDGQAINEEKQETDHW